jgi:hypothetical protein
MILGVIAFYFRFFLILWKRHSISLMLGYLWCRVLLRGDVIALFFNNLALLMQHLALLLRKWFG